MQILLLGSNGQLGADIVRASQNLSNNVGLVGWARQQMDVADVSNIYALLNKQSFDILINCTSYHKTDEVEQNADKAFAINAFAVREMARTCQVKKAKFIHVSTDYVFGGSNIRCPLVETDAPAPLNVYGASKLMGETLAAAFHDDVVILRVASLFGVAGASGKGGNFVETMIRVGREKGHLRVVNDQLMSPTSTADIADMIFKLLENGAPTGVYHAVNSGQASWYEFAKIIIDKVGISATVEPVSTAEYPVPAMRPPYSVLDNHKLSDLIGVIPEWRDGLDRYLHAKGYCELFAAY